MGFSSSEQCIAAGHIDATLERSPSLAHESLPEETSGSRTTTPPDISLETGWNLPRYRSGFPPSMHSHPLSDESERAFASPPQAPLPLLPLPYLESSPFHPCRSLQNRPSPTSPPLPLLLLPRPLPHPLHPRLLVLGRMHSTDPPCRGEVDPSVEYAMQ